MEAASTLPLFEACDQIDTILQMMNQKDYLPPLAQSVGQAWNSVASLLRLTLVHSIAGQRLPAPVEIVFQH
tara:strand:+ start:512 stop:724 length:213 start_codon:yes stop_codon:yes gene_type:complete